MPEQPADVRVRNFFEVPLGYTADMAMVEAERCLQCRKPGCVDGCPVNVDIPTFLGQVTKGDFAAAARVVKRTNALPAVCGRVCPQEMQCELKCILGKKSEPIAIGRCERFVADYVRENKLTEQPAKATSNGKRVAVVGSGPSGLTVAGDLVLRGYDVTIFEAFHKAGGVLVYGIPEFRLPKDIVETEINGLRELGVKIELNFVVGKMATIDELFKQDGYDALFIGVGAGLPSFQGIEGEDLGGVYSANEYLTRANLMKAYRFPEHDTPIARGRQITVIGGGNVAMDAARSALRLGAETVKIVYRRGRNELPARAEEVHHAEQEGVEFQLLTNPVKYISGENGMVRGILCERMQLGEPDASGRQRPVRIEGSEFELETDCVIIAIGALANPLLTKTIDGLGLNKRGYIVTNEQGRTTHERIWSGGDIVTGAATVILAMGAGRIAANDIHEYLSGNNKVW
jgi:glutamate synthase (NADPH/NADH) small chain